MPSSATYDVAKITVSVNGVLIEGFAEGSKVRCGRDVDTWQKNVGTDGTVARARNNDIGGKITISLQRTSLSNDVLSALANFDEVTGAGQAAVVVMDLLGTTLWKSADAWVTKPPEEEFATQITTREWIFDCGHLDWFEGGNV